MDLDHLYIHGAYAEETVELSLLRQEIETKAARRATVQVRALPGRQLSRRGKSYSNCFNVADIFRMAMLLMSLSKSSKYIKTAGR